MKRRNFLSGLLVAPLALKARLARFIARKPVELCNASAANLVLVRMRPDVRSPHGRIVVDMLGKSTCPKHIRLSTHAFIIGLDQPISDAASAHCCLRRGHKGPHVLLNPR